jgi:hypothetical protein
MVPATILEISDVVNKPRVKMDLPSPMRLGDKLRLRFRLSRQNGGRYEILDVVGEFQVRSVSFDTSGGRVRQNLSVESTGVAPSWKAVKKESVPPPRKLGPAKAPPTPIE